MSHIITEKLISQLSRPKMVSSLLTLRREAANGPISSPHRDAANFKSELFKPQKIIQESSPFGSILAQQKQQYKQTQVVKSNASFKWLAEKLDTDLKEVRLNFNYFKQNVHNIPFAIIQLENEAIESQEMVLRFEIKNCLYYFFNFTYSCIYRLRN